MRPSGLAGPQTPDLGILAPGGSPADDADAPEWLVTDLPGDALAALHLLRAQFPSLPGRPVAPLVLRSQVYSVVRDRTAADRELDELRHVVLRCAAALCVGHGALLRSHLTLSGQQVSWRGPHFQARGHGGRVRFSAGQ